jgi:hypothetical protein
MASFSAAQFAIATLIWQIPQSQIISLSLSLSLSVPNWNEVAAMYKKLKTF